MTRRRKRRLAGLAVVPFAVATVFWWWYTTHDPGGSAFEVGGGERWIAFGSLAGLYAATGALLQILLISRARWLEQIFGLDHLTVVHRYNASLTLVCLLVHVALVTAGHAATQLSPTSVWGQFWEFLTKWEDLPPAAAGAALLIAAGVLSNFLVRRRLKYELWYYLHLAVYAAIALAFAHQFEYGTGLTDDTPNRAFAWYWYGLYAFCFGNLFVYRLAMPAIHFARHRFVIGRVQAETADVTSVYIHGRNLHRLAARAGQFVFVRFLARGFFWEKHPFSLSRAADGKSLRLSIKSVGDFTEKIPALKAGTRVIVDGPHGVFTADATAESKLLFLAAGIGITPLRALAEELAPAGRDVVLLYGNHDERSIVFREELAALAAKNPNLRVIHVLSKPGAGPSERGHIDEEKLRRLVPDIGRRAAFLCGPPAMMASLRRTLATLGGSGDRVHYERFGL